MTRFAPVLLSALCGCSIVVDGNFLDPDAGRAAADAAVDGGVDSGERGDGQMPVDSAVDGGEPGPEYRMDDLSTSDCVVNDIGALAMQPRGGLGFSEPSLVVNGSPQVVRTDSAGLTMTSSVAAPYVRRRWWVSDLGARQAYLLGTAGGPLLEDVTDTGAALEITALHALTPRGALASQTITLSEPITIANPRGDVGLFGGRGKVAIHADGRLYTVELPAGAVSARSHTVGRHEECAEGRYYGVLEDLPLPHLLLLSDSTTLVREEVGGSDRTVIADFVTYFDPLGQDALFNGCSFTLQTAPGDAINTRFIADAPILGEVRQEPGLLVCPARMRAGGDLFQVANLSITAAACNLSFRTNTGDSEGPITVAGDRVLVTGDEATASLALDATGPRLGQLYDAMITDLDGEQGYALAFEGVGVEGMWTAGILDRLVPLAPDGGPNFEEAIELSRTVGFDDELGVFSGPGFGVVWDGGRAFRITFGTGAVEDLGSVTIDDAEPCGLGSAFYGMVELLDGELFLTYRRAGSGEIVRRSVSESEQEVVATFDDLADVCSFSVVGDRWFFAHTGSSSMTEAAGESPATTVGSCEATLITEGD